MALRIKSFAKINLGLKVLNKRSDDFHNINSIFIQIDLHDTTELDISWGQLEPLYDQAVQETKDLLQNKNHDYDEAWRDMRISSITDIILMKLFRVKQIEDNQGQTLVSEGIKANYQDMINYAVFCLIKLTE